MVFVERGQGFSSGVKEQFYCPLCEFLSLYGLKLYKDFSVRRGTSFS